MKLKKTFLYSLIFLFAALQCLFLGSIIYEQQEDIYVFPFILLFIFLLTSYFHAFIKEYHFELDSWKVGLGVYIGAFGSWYLQKYIGYQPVLATAIIGVVAGLIPVIFKNNKYLTKIPPAVYCGSFIAMSTIQSDFTFMFLASSITFLIYLSSKMIMNGIGGKLGSIAFVGVVIAYLLNYLIN